MKAAKKFLALTLCAALVLGCLGYVAPTGAKAAAAWQRGLGDALGWNQDTYYTIDKKTTNNNWRQALASANGEIAFMESGDPNEDVFIFNNTKIVFDDNGVHEAPVLSGIIDQQRVGAINHNNWVWNQAANAYDEATYGISGGRGMVWSRPYQPAAQYRIKNNDYTTANRTDYNRYTNYETAEVGAQWRDAAGNEWNRRSFASREDDVIVTYIEAPAGKELNITISMDHLTDMRNEGTVSPLPDSDYVVTQEAGQVVGFGTVAKYATRDITGTKNVGNKTLFSYGGWASATRIVLGDGGALTYKAAKRTIAAASSFSVSQAFEANDPQLTITGTGSVMLITKVDRQDDGCQTVADIRAKLYDRLQGEIAALVEEKGIASTEAGYQTLLAPHAAIHGGMFHNVCLNLCQTPEELADRALTNQQLINKQNSNKASINKAFLERVYNNGRYGLICASGYGTSRLAGIWCGTWNPSWSGDYTLDANTNLQVSGLNTGNMQDAGDGYINFILRMVADWETNATNIYGMTDAILGPPRVDGTEQGQSYHYSSDYPHVFVNGITDWLLTPIYEYWQCYGNQQIPVGKDIDLERNQSVLDWTDADVARIRANGSFDLEQDMLYPLAMKAMNFWLQFADEKYYTDGQGVRHVADGTTLSQAIAAGDEGAKYIFAPGFSPENSPEQGGARPGALAYNVSMDIAAARDTLTIARTMLAQAGGDAETLAKWAEFEKRIPDYLYEEKTGELKEWASGALKEAHNHRHESHAYAAWPGYEAQNNEEIREGLAIAMDMRSAAYGGQEAAESHGATHKALVEARLKRPVALQRVMLYLLTNGYQYSNMLTSHNNNQSSCLCTDSAFGLMGAVNESLLYSDSDVIEILPTLLPNMTAGSITGLRARSNTQVDIVWNETAVTATLTTDQDAVTLNLLCGLDWDKATVGGRALQKAQDAEGRDYAAITLEKGKATEVTFTLAADDGETRPAYGAIRADSFDAGDATATTEPGANAFDKLIYKHMDFGDTGCKTGVRLTVKNTRTAGGLNRDGSSVVKLYNTDPDSGAAALATVVIPNTGGVYKTVSLKLPARLRGVQDIYFKFQDGGCTLQAFAFEEMPIANVVDGGQYQVSVRYPLVLELDTETYSFALNGNPASVGASLGGEGVWTLTVTKRGETGASQTIRFSTYHTDADRLLPKNASSKPGEPVALSSASDDPAATLWLAPAETKDFEAGPTMTAGHGATIAAPASDGVYRLFVTDADGTILSRSLASVKVSAGLADIDFTDPASADRFGVVNQASTAIAEGEGLYLITTKDGFEPANNQLTGTAATTPKDLVLIPVEGDWEATMQFDFSQAGASNGYYQFFGFYAMQDYDNCAGIRGGDGAMQDFLRVGGTVTAETMNSQPGLASNGTYWYRIVKEGTTYTCYRSADGEDFTEMFSYADTGIEAEQIAIDAYTGMTAGYEFRVKSLTFARTATPHVHDYTAVVTKPTCTAKGYTTYTCSCGESYVADEVAALGHDIKETTVPATCTEKGSVTKACSRCDFREVTEIAALGHDISETTVDPTCTEAGSVTKTCSRCDLKEVTEIAALGHNFVNGVCTVCGEKKFSGCPSKAFTDVPAEDNWAHKGIDYCVENALMNGVSDTIFAPDGKVTRGQLVTILYRAAGSPEVTFTNRFSDVPNGKFYSSAVIWAASKGYVEGYEGGTFRPEANITREQIAAIFYRYAGKPATLGSLTIFPDAGEVHPYGQVALSWATQTGLINGVKVGNVNYLKSQASATRAQLATIIMRYQNPGRYVTYAYTDASLSPIYNAKIVATLGENKLTGAMFQFFFWSTVYNYINQNADYLAELGPDTTKSLSKQYYEGDTTWEQHFVESALESYQQSMALSVEAAKAGTTLDKNSQTYLDDFEANLTKEAISYGFDDVNKYLEQYFGPSVTVADYKAYYRISALAYAQAAATQAGMTVTDAEAEAYYDANAATYAENGIEKVDKNVVNVRHILIHPERDIDSDGDRENDSSSAKAWAAAEARANEIYSSWKRNPTEANFASMAATYSDDFGSAEYGGLYSDVYPGQMPEAFSDWCFDDARVPGSTGIVKTDIGYHIIYFSSVGDTVYWREQAKWDCAYDKLDTALDKIFTAYKLTTNYENLHIFDIIARTATA